MAPAPALPLNAAVSSCVSFLRCLEASVAPASPKTSVSAVAVCMDLACRSLLVGYHEVPLLQLSGNLAVLVLGNTCSG
jgi:hypothetical protein